MAPIIGPVLIGLVLSLPFGSRIWLVSSNEKEEMHLPLDAVGEATAPDR